jgi:hypothetical protein
MAAIIGKFVGKKILGESLENKFGQEDPYFETVPATRIDGRTSHKNTKKRRKALPQGISEHDGKVLTKVKRRAHRLDVSLFNFCGIRFGWSSVIGIVPVIGDVIDALLALLVVQTCRKVEGGLPADVQLKMLINVALDFGVGLVPFIGDIADAVFRANTRNAVVLEKHLRRKGELALKAQGKRPTLDPSDPDEFDRQEEAAPPPYPDAPSRHATQGRGGNGREPQRHDGNSQGRYSPTQPPQKQGGGGFFGFGSKKTQPDVEQGHEMGRSDPRQDRNSGQVGRQKSTLQKTRP